MTTRVVLGSIVCISFACGGTGGGPAPADTPGDAGDSAATSPTPDASSSSTDSGDRGAGDGGSADAGSVSSGPTLVPNPLVSRGKPIESPQDNAKAAFDGSYSAGDGSWVSNSAGGDGSLPDSWVKIDIGTGPTKLLLVWHNGDVPDYTIDPSINFGAPTDYAIDVSADGTTWKNVADVASVNDVTYRSRGHSFDFTGMRFVRFTMKKSTTPSGPSGALGRIVEMDIFDASAGGQDTWLFAGSGPIRGSYDAHLAPAFPDVVHGAHAAYYPAMIDIADTGPKTQYLLDHLDQWLQLNPDFEHWVLNYGLYETSDPNEPADFVAKMQTAITKLKAAGKMPMVPRLQYVAQPGCGTSENVDCSKIDAFNQAIDDLVAKNGLLPAPDLHAFFAAHPEQLCQSGQCEPNWTGIEPNDSGIRGVNAEWARVLDPLYRR